MYICNRCGKVFEDDEVVVVHDDPSPAGVGLSSGAYEYYHCPHCGSDDIDEAVECAVCGDYFIDDGEEICEECFNKIEEGLDSFRALMGVDDEVFAKVVRQIY